MESALLIADEKHTSEVANLEARLSQALALVQEALNKAHEPSIAVLQPTHCALESPG
jgi:hypothetical protein